MVGRLFGYIGRGKLENIIYTEKVIPRWLPKEVRDSAIERLNYLSELDKKRKIDQDTSSGINFAYRLFIDERMKVVWEKLLKINKKSTLRLPKSIELLHSFHHKDHLFIFDPTPKINTLETMISLCEGILDCEEMHTMYTTEFDFEEFDQNYLIGEREHTEFIDSLNIYLTRLKQILSHEQKNREISDARFYISNPISQKKNIENAEAIFWAKRIKALFLSFYKKPLNKEIGVIVSVLFDSDEYCYDEDYIAKITRDTQKKFKKLEDLKAI